MQILRHHTLCGEDCFFAPSITERKLASGSANCFNIILSSALFVNIFYAT